MSNNSNEQEFLRTDIVRLNRNYDDLANAVAATFRTYSQIVNITSPYVAKHGDNTLFHIDKDVFSGLKKFQPLDDIMFNKMLDATIEFYTKNKNSKRLQQAHIITHRSVHFSEERFKITKCDLSDYAERTKETRRAYKLNSVSKIEMGDLSDPIYIENMDLQGVKYIIIRPKLGKSGLPMVHNWEILLFKKRSGYLIDHVDSNKNPRYNGYN